MSPPKKTQTTDPIWHTPRPPLFCLFLFLFPPPFIFPLFFFPFVSRWWGPVVEPLWRFFDRVKIRIIFRHRSVTGVRIAATGSDFSFFFHAAICSGKASRGEGESYCKMKSDEVPRFSHNSPPTRKTNITYLFRNLKIKINPKKSLDPSPSVSSCIFPLFLFPLCPLWGVCDSVGAVYVEVGKSKKRSPDFSCFFFLVFPPEHTCLMLRHWK
jgi:hypothetical protein